MGKSRQQSFLGGAAVLAGAVAVVKLIGALYKIPLGNLLDAEGMAHFNVAYNMYAFLLTLSTAGLPLALSKLVSESRALGKYTQARRIFSSALILFCVIGLIGALVMFFFSRQLAQILNDSLAAASIRVLAPAVAFVCIMSAFRGYTQGLGNMTPTAISQVIEALCKLFLGLSVAWFLLDKGFGTEIAAAGAISGVTAGTAASFVFLLLYLLKQKPRRGEQTSERPLTRGLILRRILQIGVPITIGSSVMSIITLLDATILLGRLQSALGYSEEAASILYGQYTYGMNLFNLPASFMPALGASLIPFVSAGIARRDTREVSRIVSASMRITALLAFPAGIGLSVLSGPILKLLYFKVPETAAAAAPHLRVLGIAVIFVCLMLLTNSILQAHGWVNIPILTMFIGGIVKITTNYVLVGIPEINIHGAPIGTLLCYATIAALNLFAVSRVLSQKLNYPAIFFKPLIAALLMGAAAAGFYRILSGLLGSSVATLGAITIAALFYLFLVIVLRIISRDDLKFMPKGEKIANILRLK